MNRVIATLEKKEVSANEYIVVYLFPPAAPDGPGKSVWDFVCDVVCEDLCQTNDLSVVFHERKSMLVQTLSVLQALYRCHSQWCSRSDASKFYVSFTVLLSLKL